jgi:hypothetical protein
VKRGNDEFADVEKLVTQRMEKDFFRLQSHEVGINSMLSAPPHP